ncbi:hypothetical protein AVEN_198927-1 [Araneus ventricosus]|uniref:Mos1 transposase HTH domain-containing protein n=1 Tax=Araneus ventricosus TaxID=182803 RepID=A0A4Y2D399_ARAVE|nr:hypothetical protein AVEN_198927-1 [Araneus ventricosus]
MALQLETYSNVEVHGTVRFLWTKLFMSMEIHYQISAAYGSHAMSCPAIAKWCQQFEDGRTDLTYAERQGRPITVSTSNAVGKDIILSDHRVSVSHIAQELGISVGSVHSIVRQQLDYSLFFDFRTQNSKVCGFPGILSTLFCGRQ